MSVKGAITNPAYTMKAAFHERNLMDFGNAVATWKNEVRTILSDGSKMLDFQAFPDLLMYYDQFNTTGTFANADEADAQVQRDVFNKLRTQKFILTTPPPGMGVPDSPTADMPHFDPSEISHYLEVFKGFTNYDSLLLSPTCLKKKMCKPDGPPICPHYAAQLVDLSKENPYPGCTTTEANCASLHSLPLREPSKVSKRFVQATRKILGPCLT